mgnify:CR=1 FL=1
MGASSCLPPAHNTSRKQRPKRRRSQPHNALTRTPTHAQPSQYKNTFKLIKDLQLPSWPLTDFTTSGCVERPCGMGRG